MKEVSTLKKRNNRDKSPINLKLSLFFVVLIGVATVFILSVVTNSESLNHANPITEPDPKSVIQKVLELQFTGPDEKFMDLLSNPKYKMVKNGVEENLELEKYVKEVYGVYFTESELDFFMRTGGTTYQFFAYKSGYKLRFKDVSIEQHETISNRYKFTAQVGYQKIGGKEETAEVEGLVLFSTKEEGKIGKFQYGNDNGLSDSLRK